MPKPGKRPTRDKASLTSKVGRKKAATHEQEPTENKKPTEKVKRKQSEHESFSDSWSHIVTLPTLGSVAEKKELREQFRESHNKIRENIVLASEPAANFDIISEFGMSNIALGDYVTLDWKHYQEINKAKTVIREYKKDGSLRRPLNVIMQAQPGSGKSHFIQSLAKSMSQDDLSAVTFNMSSLRDVNDFIQPLEAVRNLKVVDKIPLLFLDEFDSDPKNYSMLLPLLWDGELSVGQRRLRIGKAIIILAGSGAQIGDVMKSAKGMQSEVVTGPGAGKLPDLLSRINGGELAIPDLDEVAGDRDRRVDKVCLTIALLARRFPVISSVSWAFLKFVAVTRFRYGVRSISHLVDLIPTESNDIVSLGVKDLRLPLNTVGTLKESSLAFHLISEDGPAAVVETWGRLKSVDIQVSFRNLRPAPSWSKFLTWLRTP